MKKRYRLNPASALALSQFFVIEAIEGECWYRVQPGDAWAGKTARAVARIGLPHLTGHEVVLQSAAGDLRAFSPHMIRPAAVDHAAIHRGSEMQSDSPAALIEAVR
ncbi:hypothetical protein [Achromobacter sp. DH1f]|uniref:hypothetical protein n=1 Tax=Achromobacter sp. DH1f TaxID=1397275 RepID=UPI00046A2725|nr:hypothetical protein [Achromobacter sp. DH1f]